MALEQFSHIYVLWPLALCTVTFGFPNSKKNSFRGNYMRKYGMCSALCILHGRKKNLVFFSKFTKIIGNLSAWVNIAHASKVQWWMVIKVATYIIMQLPRKTPGCTPNWFKFCKKRKFWVYFEFEENKMGAVNISRLHFFYCLSAFCFKFGGGNLYRIWRWYSIYDFHLSNHRFKPK